MRNSAVIMRSALGRPLESPDPNHELKAQTEANIIVASTQFGREKRAFGYLSKLRLFFSNVVGYHDYNGCLLVVKILAIVASHYTL